jgi:hypothetical protein
MDSNGLQWTPVDANGLQGPGVCRFPLATASSYDFVRLAEILLTMDRYMFVILYIIGILGSILNNIQLDFGVKSEIVSCFCCLVYHPVI